MLNYLIHFSTFAAGFLQEDHPPTEAMANPFNFGLTPFGVVVVVLLVIAVIWVALNAQAGRTDLHAAADHGGHHGDVHHEDAHHDSGHGH